MSSIATRIQKLETEHGRVTSEINKLKSEIDELQKKRMKAVDNPHSQEFLQHTEELNKLNAKLDDKSALARARYILPLYP